MTYMMILNVMSYAPINVTPHPLPCGLTYFYRGFDNEYHPNPGDIDIFFQQPIMALQFKLYITFYTFWQEY